MALYDREVFAALANLGDVDANVRARLDSVEVRGSSESATDFLLPLLREAHARQMSAADAQAFAYREIAAPLSKLVEQAAPSTGPVLYLAPALLADAERLEGDLGKPALSRLLRNVSSPETRVQLLRDWLEVRPSWLPQSESIDAWLGEVALDAGQLEIARSWLVGALAAGATPRPYLLVRMATTRVGDDEAFALLKEVRGHPLVETVILSEHDLEARQAFLREWSPTSETQRGLWAALNVQQLLEGQDLDGAIRVGQSAFDVDGFAAPGVIAAQALIQRSMTPGRESHVADLSAARSLAIRVRDARRSEGVAAPRAIRVAMHASMLLIDFSTARALFTPAPDGLATPEEASHPDVHEAAVSVLAQLGDISGALKLVSDRTPAEVVLQLRATEAELAGDDDTAHRLWSEAVDAHTDWAEKTSLCFHLASRGIAHRFVDELRPGNEAIAHELDTIVQLFQRRAGSESRAEAMALDNPRIARALAMYYSEADRHDDSLRLAEQVARQWGDPDEWLRAARFYLRRGEHSNAIDRARTAFTVGGEAWGDRASALRLQIAALQDTRQWEDVVSVGRLLLRIQPDSADAGWSVIFALHKSADDEQAFATWKSLPACRQPVSVPEASLWLHLYQRFGTEMAQFSEVLSIIERFPLDEQVRRLAIGAALLAPVTAPDVQIQVTELAEEYHTDFPNHPRLLWTLDLDGEDAGSILAALDAAAGGPRKTNEIEEKAANGTFPIGLLSMWAKRSYAEVLVSRRVAPRFGGTAEGAPAEHKLVEQALRSGVAIDTTAALTLALLPADLGELLAKLPARLLGTYDQLRDVRDASLRLKNAQGEFFPSTVEREPMYFEESPEEVAKQHTLLKALETRLRRSERADPPPLAVPVTSLENISGAWTAAMDRAGEAGVPLWCDDAATRQVAAALGVPAFGTPELTAYARDKKLIAADTADSIDAALIHSCMVGVHYRPAVWHLALTLSSFRPEGLAQAILFGGPDYVVEKLHLVLAGIRNCLTDPNALSAWASVAAKFLSDMTATDAEAVENLVLLLQALLAVPWLAPHQFAFVARGVRAQSGDRWFPALRAAAGNHWRGLVAEASLDVSASYILAQVGGLSSEERQLVLEVVLRNER
ncbi:PIN domain-containing protein [Microbacterium hatanonis]|uniref:PIN domain-containing protein n=1 Tax=Microbacterium hatanonis TaxID=404366 RepID=A0A5C8I357_9MICO|nr:hypothetical protein [Microbacterium hatanonis]TXK12323.1 hypothetical protein FVP77_02250 [Microbacterium hatanonis]